MNGTRWGAAAFAALLGLAALFLYLLGWPAFVSKEDVEMSGYLEQRLSILDEADRKNFVLYWDCYKGKVPLPIYERQKADLWRWRAAETARVKKLWGKR